jgi:c-di-GMP-binding flagellar brake protein YcgR
VTVNSAIANIIAKIGDKRQAIVKLATKGGQQQRFESIYREDEAPYFFLVFPPDTLPENLDFEANHPLAILQEPATISLDSSIVERRGDRTLYMIAKGTLDPSKLRDYFRVNTNTEITASYTPGSTAKTQRSWVISGQTQDLSGSGALALFGDEPKNRDHIMVEIFLPHKNTTINAVGHVVRKKRLRNGRWQVSFHFDSISSKHRDAIITHLLSEQRKQLRENVRTSDV